MKTIKTATLFPMDFVKYPNGINTIEEFAKFINENYSSFIELEVYSDDNCAAPYFIENETKKVYVNPAFRESFREKEIYLCTEEEYVERLKKVINKKCIHCVNYIDNGDLDLNSHREKINLDGECYLFKKKEEN